MIDRCLAYISKELEIAMKPLEKFLKWLFDSKGDSHSSPSAMEAIASLPWKAFFILILVLVIGCLIFIFFRHFRQRTILPTAVLATTPFKTIDLEAENIRADALP